MADATVICVGGTATSAGFGPSLPDANLMLAVNACRARADFGYSGTAGVWITTIPAVATATAEGITLEVSGTAVVISVAGLSTAMLIPPTVSSLALIIATAGTAFAELIPPLIIDLRSFGVDVKRRIDTLKAWR